MEDFDQVGTTEGSSRVDFGSLSLNSHNSFVLNATGLGWIKKAGQTSACGTGTGMTCLGTREGHDLLNSVITQNTGNLVYGAYSEASGTTTDPYLEITYEVAGQPTPYQNISYTYDPVGNVTNISENANTSAKRNVSYSYDDLHRLTRASSTNIVSGNFIETYGYNAVGNITSKSDLGSYQYSGNTGTNYANPHAPTTINSVALTYDSNGNLLSHAGRNNSWNYRNELVSTTGTASTTAVYDHVGERIQYTDTSSATLYPNREYDFETVSDTKTKFIYAGDDLVATIETKPVLESMNGYSFVGYEIEGQQSSSMCCQNEIPVSHTIHYVHSDHLGGSNVVTDSSGALEETLDYYPFGEIRIDESTSSFSEAHKFIGEFYDEESQLSYLNARYQDGKRGQFLSQDPVFLSIGSPTLKEKTNLELQEYLSDPQVLNSYSYTRNNPLKYLDQSGEFIVPAIIAAAPALIGLASFVAANAPAVGAFLSNPGLGARIAPISGDAISAKEAVSGRDAFTGEPLSSLDRTLSVVGAIPALGVLGDAGRSFVKAGDTISGLRVTKHAAEGFNGIRNMQPNQVGTAINEGVKYLDTRTNNLLHIVGEKGRGGYTIVTDRAQKTLVSVENFIRNLTPKNSPGRFKRLDTK